MAFKMKGSPFQRNFGIGISPAKQKKGFTKEPLEKIEKIEKTQQPEAKKSETAKTTKKMELSKTKRDTPGWTPKPPKTSKAKINLPKDHPVTPPTTEQSKRSKGTVKGRTGFEYDVVDPIKSKLTRVASKAATFNPIVSNTLKGIKKTQHMKAGGNWARKGAKDIKDYFTKR